MTQILNVKTERVAVDKLTPHPANPRQGDVDAVAESIETNGFYGTIVAQVGTNHILAGNHRWMAAKQAGLTRVPVVWVDVEDEQALRIMLADNRTNDIATYDDEALADLLKDLSTSPDGLLGTGYDDAALDNLLGDLDAGSGNGTGGDPDPDPLVDKADELLKKWGVVDGDVWRAGDQYVICGDATVQHTWDIAAAIAYKWEAAAACIVTSPPYAQQRNYTKAITDWTALMTGVFAAMDATDITAEDTQLFVNLGIVHRSKRVARYWDEWLDAMETSGWPLFGWYVWDQGPGMPGDAHGRLGSAYEFVFHFAQKTRRVNKTVECAHAGQIKTGAGQRDKDGVVRDWNHAGQPTQDRRVADSVLRITRQKTAIEAGDHPAVFPPRLPAALLDSFTQPGEIVVDPFLGSGSTLLAAHAADRKGIGIELAPKYVAVALERLLVAGIDPERAA